MKTLLPWDTAATRHGHLRSHVGRRGGSYAEPQGPDVWAVLARVFLRQAQDGFGRGTLQPRNGFHQRTAGLALQSEPWRGP